MVLLQSPLGADGCVMAGSFQPPVVIPDSECASDDSVWGGGADSGPRGGPPTLACQTVFILLLFSLPLYVVVVLEETSYSRPHDVIITLF